MDYSNIYESVEYKQLIEKNKYIENDDYFEEESMINLSDGYYLEIKSYIHKSELVIHGEFNRCKLCKEGECIYEYISIDGCHNPYEEMIIHRNGHRYYPFHIDLYGISYIDVDTREIYNYIPKGNEKNGESFIITEIHYDAESNLIAYGGCYWACPSDVMVGDFSTPLSFDPHLISIHEILDIDYEKYDDIDFDSWDHHHLKVKLDSDEFATIDMATIRNRLSLK